MTTVDWSRPIEAVHEDGRVRSVTQHGGVDDFGLGKPRWYISIDGAGHWPFNDHGVAVQAEHTTFAGWRIRNVTKSVTTSRPSDEIVERMVALIRRYADSPMCAGDLHTMREASAIVAELPEVVDGDLVEARRMAPDAEDVDIVLAAIRRGRQLQREGL